MTSCLVMGMTLFLVNTYDDVTHTYDDVTTDLMFGDGDDALPGKYI